MILSTVKKTPMLPKLQQRILDLEIIIEIIKKILQDTIRNLTKKKSDMVQRLFQGLQDMNGDKSKEIINQKNMILSMKIKTQKSYLRSQQNTMLKNKKSSFYF